jgi:methylmalonyl-CoA mutase
MALVNRFAPVSDARWREIAQAALKSADLAKLTSRAEDGISIAPIYARRDGQRIPRSSGAWGVVARVDHPDSHQANDFALDDIANGASGLEIIFAGAGGAYGYGLAKWDQAALRDLFEGVDLDAGVSIDLDLGPASNEQALAVSVFVARRAASLGNVDLCFGLDPLGAFARSGRAPEDWPNLAASIARTAATLRDRGFAGPFVVADGRSVHDAGSSPAQELGFILACAIDYFRALSANGFALEAARDGIAFRLAADADEFLSLSKFRALRLLWARVLEACGLAPNVARLHGAGAWRTMSAKDPWVNVMRGAMAAFCAGLGGADTVSVLPFTQAIGLPDSFARRLARNAQLIFIEESHLGFVADPAAGAGAFEALTRELCDKAWAVFQTIVAGGGAYASLASGVIQVEIAKTAAMRFRQIADRKLVMTGVSDFPDLAATEAATALASRPEFGYMGEQRAAPLVAHRLSEPFEAFRDKSDAFLKRTGSRPRIFQANVGGAADFGARAAFAKSLFEAGGIEALDVGGVADADEARRAFAASGAKLACLCSSDAVYAAQAEEVARALHAAGAQWIAMAGKPGEREAVLRAAGVDQFIFANCDALAALSAAYSCA